MSERGPEEDLADRLSAVEQQQQTDRRALASLDADVSVLQTQRRQDMRLLQSLRDTQIEHGERLTRLESGLERLRSDMASGFAAVGGHLDVIVELLRRDND